MRTIKFKVNQQRIKNVDSVCHVYPGTDNYLNLQFIFDSNWDGCVKAISFVLDNGQEFPMLLKDDACLVPAEAFCSDQLSFYLVGKTKTYRIETQKFVINLGGQ